MIRIRFIGGRGKTKGKLVAVAKARIKHVARFLTQSVRREHLKLLGAELRLTIRKSGVHDAIIEVSALLTNLRVPRRLVSVGFSDTSVVPFIGPYLVHMSSTVGDSVVAVNTPAITSVSQSFVDPTASSYCDAELVDRVHQTNTSEAIGRLPYLDADGAHAALAIDATQMSPELAVVGGLWTLFSYDALGNTATQPIVATYGDYYVSRTGGSEPVYVGIHKSLMPNTWASVNSPAAVAGELGLERITFVGAPKDSAILVTPPSSNRSFLLDIPVDIAPGNTELGITTPKDPDDFQLTYVRFVGVVDNGDETVDGAVEYFASYTPFTVPYQIRWLALGQYTSTNLHTLTGGAGGSRRVLTIKADQASALAMRHRRADVLDEGGVRTYTTYNNIAKWLAFAPGVGLVFGADLPAIPAAVTHSINGLRIDDTLASVVVPHDIQWNGETIALTERRFEANATNSGVPEESFSTVEYTAAAAAIASTRDPRTPGPVEGLVTKDSGERILSSNMTPVRINHAELTPYSFIWVLTLRPVGAVSAADDYHAIYFNSTRIYTAPNLSSVRGPARLLAQDDFSRQATLVPPDTVRVTNRDGTPFDPSVWDVSVYSTFPPQRPADVFPYPLDGESHHLPFLAFLPFDPVVVSDYLRPYAGVPYPNSNATDGGSIKGFSAVAPTFAGGQDGVCIAYTPDRVAYNAAWEADWKISSPTTRAALEALYVVILNNFLSRPSIEELLRYSSGFGTIISNLEIGPDAYVVLPPPADAPTAYPVPEIQPIDAYVVGATGPFAVKASLVPAGLPGNPPIPVLWYLESPPPSMQINISTGVIFWDTTRPIGLHLITVVARTPGGRAERTFQVIVI